VTLIIAWQNADGGVCLASDSLVKLGEDKRGTILPSFQCLKLGVVHAKVYGANDSKTGDVIQYADTKVGIAMAGNFLASYGVLAALRPALEKVQVAHPITDPSLGTIVEVIGAVMETVCCEVGRAISDVRTGRAGMFVAGWCPVENESQAYELRFDPIATSNGSWVTIRRIELKDGPAFLGSGADAARKKISDYPEIKPLTVLHQVIDDPNVSGVGGYVQYGIVEDRTGFAHYAVEDYTVDHDMKEILICCTYGGVAFAGPGSIKMPDGVVIAHTAVLPFRKEINSYIADRYNPVPLLTSVD
jgi:hypothetical protein